MPAVLTQSVTATPTRPTALTAWHLLSLDAPTVATLWTAFLARTTHTPLPPTLLPAMFLAVWALYAADRLLDARFLDARLLDTRRLDTRNPIPHTLEARHLFHRRHARAFLLAIACATLALIPLVAFLPHRDLALYTALGLLLAAWFTLVHVAARNRPSRWVPPLQRSVPILWLPLLKRSVPILWVPHLNRSHRLRWGWSPEKSLDNKPTSPHPAPRPLPKELAAAFFFAAATAIPTHTPPLLATLFALLCALNLFLISHWEQPPASRLDAPSSQPSQPTLRAPSIAPFAMGGSTNKQPGTNKQSTFLPVAAFTLILFPATLIPVHPTQALVLLAIALASIALLALHLARRRIPRTTLRALADLALLTPLLLWPWLPHP